MDQSIVTATLVIVVSIMVILQVFQEQEIRRLGKVLDHIYDTIIGAVSEDTTQ